MALAAVHLISERRRAREEATREQLAEQAVIEEVDNDDEGQSCALVGLPPVELPHEPAAIRGDPIPLGVALGEPVLLGGALRMREAGSQTGFGDLPDDAPWEEVEGPLQQAKDLDNLSIEVREKAFAALDQYHALHPEPNPAVNSW